METMTLKQRLHEWLSFLDWFSEAEERGRVIKTAQLGRELDYTAQISPACYAAWITELKALSPADRKRYRACFLIPIIERITPIAANDLKITPAMREDAVRRLGTIKDELAQITRKSS